MQTLPERCRALVVELGLGAGSDVAEVVPLTGGVASDIAMVGMPNRRYCVKFALPKLKVDEDWHAPVHRNQAEYEWLSVAARIVPEGAVQLFGRSEAQHGFAMDFLEGEGVTLWKAELLRGAPVGDAPAVVGNMLGRIHAASARPGFDTAPFQNRDDFRALRIEPYLSFTATRHPEVAAELTALADMLYQADWVLVHGDVSPKNILFRDGRPVFLDAECATMGDASFDPSFCLNHLILKAVHLPPSRAELLRGAVDLWTAYAAHVDWEDAAALEARVCRLVPALMLARVDGKSPVEYFDETDRDTTRSLALALLRAPETTISGLVAWIETKLKEITK